jgi:GNAT superfamily N-acetyltransferase
MEITYRKMEITDIDTIIELRISQLMEEAQDKSEINLETLLAKVADLKNQLKSFYLKYLSDDSYVSWIALDKDKIIATSGMSFTVKPPYFSNLTGKIGVLSSMYTIKEYRRKGISKKLLDKVVDEAKTWGCGCVYVTASDMGVFLYKSYGFQENQNFMQLLL